MKPRLFFACAGLLLAGGCSVGGRTQGGPATGHIGAPAAEVDARLIGQVQEVPAPDYRLPDRITLPASYRLMLLDGHLTLVREADSQALDPSPASMRVVSGEIARGELAYQPALLPQELAAEVAANRESAARMDEALASVMARSRELSDQAKQAQAQSQKMAELLAAAEARIRAQEPAAHPGAPRPDADTPQARDEP